MKTLRTVFGVLFGVLAILCGSAVFAGLAAYFLGEAWLHWSYFLLLPGAGGMIWVDLGWRRKNRPPNP